MTALSKLHADIDARVQTIRGSRPDWLCVKGCDSCCRRLAEVPQLTGAEWSLLREGLAALPPERLRAVSRSMAVLASQPTRPIVCPLLDQPTGACMVYVQRPAACRTYGFYVQRELGLYCQDIESRVADGSLADVVWGNHDAIDHRLGGLGETQVLTEWFERWENEKISGWKPGQVNSITPPQSIRIGVMEVVAVIDFETTGLSPDHGDRATKFAVGRLHFSEMKFPFKAGPAEKVGAGGTA